MPSFLAEDGPGKTSSMTPGLSSLKDRFTRKPTERDSQDNQDERASHLPNGDAVKPNGKLNGGPPERLHEMPNGVSSSTEADHDGDAWHEKYPRSLSRNSRNDSENQQTDGNHTRVVNGRPVSSDEGSFANAGSGHEVFHRLCGTTAVALTAEDQVDGAVESAGAFEDVDAEPAAQTSTPSETPATSAEYERPGRPRAGTDGALKVPNAANRASSPAAFQTPQSLTPTMTQHSQAPRLQQRHTLEVPRVSTTRLSREMTSATSPDDSVLSATGRFSPHTPRGRRGSMSLVRRATRSVASDLHLDDLSPDDDAARWAEVIRQKRASKRKRKEEEDEDRVVVGTKVDQNHVNWVTAYNMLTGIRFTVSRTNAKLDRELTDADFDAKHKFSFDM